MSSTMYSVVCNICDERFAIILNTEESLDPNTVYECITCLTGDIE